MTSSVGELASGARRAARILATATEAQRNEALDRLAAAIDGERDNILSANAKDLEAAEKMVAAGELGEPLLKRLSLQGSKFEILLDVVDSVRKQRDPLGETQRATELASGLDLYRISVPIGVLGVIFESRPDALVQIASLCLKSGNAVLLKGGREAALSNAVLAQLVQEATSGEGIPDGWLGLLETRDDVRSLLQQVDEVDLIIPRGSNEFVQYIMENTRIPVMGHADGVCHVFVDRDADLEKALPIVIDSKTQYVAVCNAAETLLVHSSIAAQFLAAAVPALKAAGVELRGDQLTIQMAQANGAVRPVTEEDWRSEYLDYIISIKVVEDLDEAVSHINNYGSHHTDAIVTENDETARTFFAKVDSASVIQNASTRFADGFRYGLGAEVGISTNRIHSRGPVGLEGLTIYKYIVRGDGQVVADFEGEGSSKSYTHRDLEAESSSTRE